jgi:multiple sugar transport system permease protein
MSFVNERPPSWASRTALVVFTALYVLPFLYVIVTSVKSSRDIFRNAASLIFTPQFDAFERILTPALANAVQNSLIIAFGSATVTLLIAVPAAYGLSRLPYSRAFTVVLAFLIILQMVPQASAVLPLYRVLGLLGLLGTHVGVILAVAASQIPFAVIMLRPFFTAIPGEVIEAATLDNAGRFGTFRYIALPLARNGIITVGVMLWIFAWGEFLYPISFMSSPSDLTMSALIGQQVQQYGTQWGPLMALSLVACVPVLIVFLMTRKLLTEGLTVGATKG